MKQIIDDRVTAKVDGEFVILVIGMYVRQWWKVYQWLPVIRSMFKMIKEQEQQPSIGLLASEHRLLGNPTVFIQYWRSYHDLEAYAKAANKNHLPAWKSYNRLLKTKGNIGIYHEIYTIKPDQYECVYVNMPPFGLGKFSQLVPATGKLEHSRGRMYSMKEFDQ